MLLKVGDVVMAIGAMLDDPSNEEFDKDYCLPFINLAWMDIAAEFSALGLQYQEEVVEVPAVAAGTSELRTQQEDGGLLESMILPTLVEWKRVGEPATRYQKALLRQRLPDVGASAIGIFAYQWRKGILFITPSEFAVDIRVTFKAYSLDFVDPISAVVVGAGNLIAYRAAMKICAPAVRNNPQQMQVLASEYREAADNFEVMCVKQKNQQGFRIGSMRSGRFRRVSAERRPMVIFSSSTTQGGTMGTRHSPVNPPDGIREDFTFIGLPDSDENFQLFINGVMTTSGFTRVGTTITFTFPIPADAEIYAFY